MTSMPTRVGGRWLSALAAARSGVGMANLLWAGDSLSELNSAGLPLPWQVGHVLSDRVETTQYRNAAGEVMVPSMITTGRPTSLDRAGLGGWAVELTPGETSSIDAPGRAVTVLWTRQPGGGTASVRWADHDLGTIETDGGLCGSRATTFVRPGGHQMANLIVGSRSGTALIEGVYVHAGNDVSGVRVWPAARSGNTSRGFVENPRWLIESLDSIAPDLVVIATGTNDDDHPRSIAHLVSEVRARAPESEIALWLPPLTTHFTVEQAAAGRALAMAEGCAVIDAAGDLGSLPTIDGVHSVPVTTAVLSAHAAEVLMGGTGQAAVAAAQTLTSLDRAQSWSPGTGTVTIDAQFKSTMLAGRSSAEHANQEWVLLPPELARSFLGLPGVSLSFGPGGDAPIDAHISRVGPGHISLNAGSGQVDVARMLVQPGPAPTDPASGPLLFARGYGPRSELAVMFPDGTSRTVADSSAPAERGFVPPLPCAIAPHRRWGADVSLPSGRVVWVPFPVVGSSAVATHVWIDVVAPAVGATATAAITTSDGHGRPGVLLATTLDDAIDLSVAGVQGAPLVEPTVLPVAAGWWVAVVVHADGDEPIARGGEDLVGRPTIHAGSAPPVVPGQDLSAGALHLDRRESIPEAADLQLRQLHGPVPVLHVSLEAP